MNGKNTLVSKVVLSRLFLVVLWLATTVPVAAKQVEPEKKATTSATSELALGLDPLSTIIQIGSSGFGLHASLEGWFLNKGRVSFVGRVFFNTYKRDDYSWRYGGAGVGIRAYLFDQAFGSSPAPLGGLFVQAGPDLEFWGGSWPSDVADTSSGIAHAVSGTGTSRSAFCMALPFMLGWKYRFSVPGVFLEPVLGYRPAFGGFGNSPIVGCTVGYTW